MRWWKTYLSYVTLTSPSQCLSNCSFIFSIFARSPSLSNLNLLNMACAAEYVNYTGLRAATTYVVVVECISIEIMIHCYFEFVALQNEKNRALLNFARFDSLVCILSLTHAKNLALCRSSCFSLATARSRCRFQVYSDNPFNTKLLLSVLYYSTHCKGVT